MVEQSTSNQPVFKCVGPTITPERVMGLRKEIVENENLHQFRNVLHAISGKMRSRILYLLHLESELCVCDLSDILDESLSAVSHQLKILRKHGLVETRRDAKTIFYSLNESVLQEYINPKQLETLIALAV